MDNDTSENYDGVVGKALLERRTGINGTCRKYECSVMDCLYCDNCYYRITLDNGETIAYSVKLKEINDENRELFTDDYEILFYDFVPKIDDLFCYLFDEDSHFRLVKKNDNIRLVDNHILKEINKKNIKPLADDSELKEYKDFDTEVCLWNNNAKMYDTDIIIDIYVDEYYGYDNLESLHETYRSRVYLEVLDKNSEKRNVSLALWELSNFHPFIYEKDVSLQEMEQFYETNNDYDNFNHLFIYEKLTRQQAIDMFEILNKKRDKIGFNYCNEGVLFKNILKTSKLFNSKDTILITLFNKYLGTSDYAPTIESLYNEYLSENDFLNTLKKSKKKIIDAL